MIKETLLITLTAEDILSLIMEKSVKRKNLCISSNSSFLAILGLLDDEMIKRLAHVKFIQT